jgi:adenylate cyclase
MTAERVERRLAAILSADVVGFSRLMEADESGTLARLQAERRELIEPKIGEHNGRVVKLMGDGVLVEFASVVDAVECAVGMQRGMAERNAALGDGQPIVLRIGINLGDVIIEGGDIYGDGVNLAARLEALAEPGGVAVSRAVRDQVSGKLDLTFESLGERSVKNMARPIEVFRIAVDRPPGRTAKAAVPPAERPGIAVLPFANLSGDPEQEYFSDGITEDIITDLSKVSALFVIARNSVFTYKGRAVKVPEVCRELGVGHVLEGSVRKAGNRVRVTAQLIDGKSGGHLWGERYDRELSDVFAVQDELTRQIVDALRVRLTPDESARVGQSETESVEAYDLVLRAAEQHYRVTRDANEDAQRLLERALALSPNYARAHALIAINHLQVASNGWAANPRPKLDLAYAAACEAVALDDRLALAHHAKGNVALWLRRFDEANAEMDLALRLEPNDAASHSIRASILAWSGDPEEAVAAAETAIRHDPRRSLGLFNAGLAYFEAGRYADALAMLQRGAVRRPDFAPMFGYLAGTLARLGRHDEAKAALGKALEINPNLGQTLLRGLLPYRDPQKLDGFVATLAELDLPG